jgi:putative membrane protein
MRLLAIWIINALALLALPYVVPSVHVASFGTALIVALVLGLIRCCGPAHFAHCRSRC